MTEITLSANKIRLVPQSERPQNALQIAPKLGLLAISLGFPYPDDGVRLEMNAIDLSDIPMDVLVMGLDVLRKSARFMPAVGEIREVCGYSEKHLEAVEVAEAWDFVQNYVKHHGIYGRDYARIVDIEAVRNCTQCTSGMVYSEEKRAMVRCSCRTTELIAAPEIPARIQWTLRQIGGELPNALEMCARPKYAKVREMFDEFYRQSKVTLVTATSTRNVVSNATPQDGKQASAADG